MAEPNHDSSQDRVHRTYLGVGSISVAHGNRLRIQSHVIVAENEKQNVARTYRRKMTQGCVM